MTDHLKKSDIHASTEAQAVLKTSDHQILHKLVEFIDSSKRRTDQMLGLINFSVSNFCIDIIIYNILWYI